MERSRNLQGILILLVVIGLLALYLYQNTRPGITVSVPEPTATPEDAPPPAWECAARAACVRCDAAAHGRSQRADADRPRPSTNRSG